MDQFVLDFDATKNRRAEIDLSENDEKTLAAIGPFTMLRAARRFVEENAGDGVNCPCCGRLVKEYRRKLNAGMAATLVWLVGEWERTGRAYVDVQRQAPARILRSREIGKLRHFGLVAQKEGASALWMPTVRGVDFVRGKNRLLSHVILRDNVFQQFDGALISIEEALGEKFDFNELMAGRVRNEKREKSG